MKKIVMVMVVLMMIVSIVPKTALAAKPASPGKSGMVQKRTVEQKQKDDVVVLKQEIKALQTSRKATISAFTETLRQGSRNDAIAILQTLLSTYPEISLGKADGSFGPKTKEAVKKFQAMKGLKADGVVGTKTKKALEDDLDENDLAVEEKDGKKRACSIIPPGHLIAPGWLKKNGGVALTIPTCQKLPPGIAKKLGVTPPAGTDTTAPVISAIASSDITATTAKIKFTTDETTTGKIWLSTVTPVVLADAVLVTDTTATKNHEITLTGLVPEKTYYYIVGASDASANASSGDQGSFTTGAGDADTTKPVISGTTATAITKTGATITWTTNEPATSKVYYGTGNPLDLGTALSQSSSGLQTNHSVVISGLTANLTYYYVVEAADLANNKTTEVQKSFTTQM